MQRVAFDPLAAVEQPSQVGDRTVHSDSARVLDGLAGGHLIRHRADPADARRDVRWFGVAPATQHRLEEARRLVYFQRDVRHRAMLHAYTHGAFAFYSG